jgi:hypothetical protein
VISIVQVLNKKQGTKWDIEDPAMLKRMKADPEHYEFLPELQKEDEKGEKDKPAKVGK